MSDKNIGDILKEANNLGADQVATILDYQRANGVKFGEAAVALGMVKRDDVLWALSKQFDYPYTTSDGLSKELVLASAPFSEQAEEFRDVRSQLLDAVFAQPGSRRAVAVVSPNVGDGKSYFAANLAIAFSQLGSRTLLVDADFRTPRQHQMFDAVAANGLSSYLAARAEVNVLRPLEDFPDLYLLPVGIVPPNPLELVQRPAFMELLSSLREKFEYIIIDTPAAEHGADCKAVAAAAGAALIVGRKGQSGITPVKNLLKSLQRVKVNVAGLVLNEH
ncbi:polysaccharide biosynthesis tyrosine autokinase [Aquabacterium sp.]|uniref:polysaccharide biosynthesis tyrosine autokinase n=1 Tax=Aquabacterium sp. TaxID=1872578 RepID=UPI0025BB0319|nr:polysaccharide biosynthesis tyrosine autokinase [Aquabacterium sp.]